MHTPALINDKGISLQEAYTEIGGFGKILSYFYHFYINRRISLDGLHHNHMWIHVWSIHYLTFGIPRASIELSMLMIT